MMTTPTEQAIQFYLDQGRNAAITIGQGLSERAKAVLDDPRKHIPMSDLAEEGYVQFHSYGAVDGWCLDRGCNPSYPNDIKFTYIPISSKSTAKEILALINRQPFSSVFKMWDKTIPAVPNPRAATTKANDDRIYILHPDRQASKAFPGTTGSQLPQIGCLPLPVCLERLARLGWTHRGMREEWSKEGSG